MEIKSLRFFLTGVLIIISLIIDVICDPVVQMGTTQIIGESYLFEGQQVNQFLSIPYAEPPIGELRFQKTVPLQQYADVIYAKDEPPACMQYTEHPWPWYINSTHKSEDCLYLNIWTPADASPQNRKSVMFWIHGGGYRYGSIQDKLYSGIVLAALGDVIVVTANFRLGPFGHLTSYTDDAPGNAALWDILEGLKWVNQNIANFGGDPTGITHAGESTGSGVVGLFSVSPLTQGLFRRQIMQSLAPTELVIGNMIVNLMFSQQVAKIVGCADDEITIENSPKLVVECLQGVDPVSLSKADFLILPRKSIAFTPRYGDAFLPEDPREVIFHKKFHCTELLVGNTKDEGSFLITTHNPESFGFFGEKNTLLTKEQSRDTIRRMSQNFADPEAVVNHYLPDDFPEDDYAGIRYQVYTSVGDMTFLCPDVYHAEKCAKNGGKVYFYWWAHRSSNIPWSPWMGVAHFTELDFIFGQPLLNPYNFEPEELEISEQMIEIWSSFVKYGKPSLAWPLYSRKKSIFQVPRPWNYFRKKWNGSS